MTNTDWETTLKQLYGHRIQRVDFWLYKHFRLFWCVIHWNWFDPLSPPDYKYHFRRRK